MRTIALAFIAIYICAYAPARSQNLTCSSFGASEVSVEILPSQPVGEASVGITIWAADGTLIYSDLIYSDEGCDWKWSFTGDKSVDFNCDITDPEDTVCPYDEFIIRIGAKSYLYAPNVGDPYGGLYWPRLPSAQGNVDIGFGYFIQTGETKARPELPGDTSNVYYEDIFASLDYIIPYNEHYWLAEAGETERPNYFLSPVDIGIIPYSGTSAIGNIDPFDFTFTFSSETDARFESDWESTVWDIPDLTLRFPEHTSLVVEGDLTAEDVTFTELTTGQGWGGLDVASTGTLTVSGVTITDPDYVDVAGAFEVMGTVGLTARGGTYRFASGVEASVLGRFDVQDVRFTELSAGQGWGGIRVAGDDGLLVINGVIVEHAEVGITVASNSSNGIKNALLTDNGVGILTDGDASGLFPARSYFVLRESCVVNSVFDDLAGLEGYGIWGRYTDARIVNTTVEDNDGYGINFDNADLLVAHGVLVTGNGADPTSSNRDGVRSGPYGDVVLASPFGGSGFDVGPDRNSVHDNARAEVYIEDTGYATVGALCTALQGGGCPEGNRVSEGGFPGDSDFLINNEPSAEIAAARVYWATPFVNPPDAAFFQPTLVSDLEPLSSDPTSDAGRPLGCAPSTFIGSGIGGMGRSASAPTRAAAGVESATPRELDPETIAWLRARIVSMRTALAENPAADTSAALLGRLYALQRLDRTDLLGEHEATMGLLASLRARLMGEGSLPPALRATAEAALTAGMHDLLGHAAYDEARAVLAAFQPRVESEGTRRALDLAAVALDEVGGDYASALARIDALLSGLGEGDEQLAADLRATARLIARKMGDEGYRESEAPAQVASAAEGAPSAFGLGAAYPNPFNPVAVIPFALDASADVRLAVYDVLGRRVALLAEGRFEAGAHTVRFDASALPSGTYLVRMTAAPEGGAAQTFTQRITLLR